MTFWGRVIVAGIYVTALAVDATITSNEDRRRRAEFRARQSGEEYKGPPSRPPTLQRQESQEAKKHGIEFEADLEIESLTCPITQELIVEPATTIYGHLFELSAIRHWVLQKGRCPLTQKPLRERDIVPQYGLQATIEEMRKMKKIELDKDKRIKELEAKLAAQENASGNEAESSVVPLTVGAGAALVAVEAASEEPQNASAAEPQAETEAQGGGLFSWMFGYSESPADATAPEEAKEEEGGSREPQEPVMPATETAEPAEEEKKEEEDEKKQQVEEEGGGWWFWGSSASAAPEAAIPEPEEEVKHETQAESEEPASVVDPSADLEDTKEDKQEEESGSWWFWGSSAPAEGTENQESAAEVEECKDDAANDASEAAVEKPEEAQEGSSWYNFWSSTTEPAQEEEKQENADSDK